MARTCVKCGVKQNFISGLPDFESIDGELNCENCARVVRERIQAIQAQKRAVARAVIVTTTGHVEGHRVVRYLGIESVEFVIGTGAFSEISSSLADFLGKRSGAFERKLQDAKRQAMEALKIIAEEAGANAVIGVDLDYAEFQNNRVALVINGTLVQIAPSSASAANG